MIFAEALLRMMFDHGPLDLFPGSVVPTHTNAAGPSRSVDLETGMMLKNFVEWSDAETVVELGTFRGYSTAWLILGGLLREINPDYNQRPTHVHAYEVFDEGEYGSMWYDQYALDKRNFVYHTIPGGIWNYLDQIPPKIDLIFHDTEHNVNPTVKEMGALLPRVQPGGLVLIDDMKNPEYPAMQNYLNTLFTDDAWDWTVLPIGHGLGVARKR